MGLVPFHFWALDVYGTICNELLFFFFIFNKSVLIFTFLKLQLFLLKDFKEIVLLVQPFATSIIIASIILSIVGAFTEKNFQKFLAFSSLTQISYILLGSFSLDEYTIIASIGYLVTYIFTLLIIFGICSVLGNQFKFVTDFTGLFYFNKVLAIIFVAAFMSFAAIPPFIGFIAKFCFLYQLFESGYFIFTFIILLSSIISIIYYLRICITIFTVTKKYSYMYPCFNAIEFTNLNSSIENIFFRKLKFYFFLFSLTFLLVILNFKFFSILSYFDI